MAVYSVGEAAGHRYIAMELVEGRRTLRDLIDETGHAPELPAGHYRRVAELFAAVADALQVAHEAGVVHRDVKPRNILIAGDGRPRVADFGLAKIAAEESLTETGQIAGTYCYMSPEQAQAERMGVDYRTDVFSLGSTFYEVLTLTRPFEGDTSHQVLLKVVHHDPPDPRRIRSRVPGDLSVICMKAIEKRRDHRYQTMRALAADLRRHLDN